MVCDGGDRNQNDVSTHQGASRIADNHQKLGKGKKGSSLKAFIESKALLALNFGLLASKAVKE